jgi:hypothetical protein
VLHAQWSTLLTRLLSLDITCNKTTQIQLGRARRCLWKCWWLIALALAGFLGVQVAIHFGTLNNPPPLALRIFLVPFAGLVFAFYIAGTWTVMPSAGA